jgi:hypothetical protein
MASSFPFVEKLTSKGLATGVAQAAILFGS